MFCFQVRLIILMSDNRTDYKEEYKGVGRNLSGSGIKLIDYIFPTKYTTAGTLSPDDISKIMRAINSFKSVRF